MNAIIFFEPRHLAAGGVSISDAALSIWGASEYQEECTYLSQLKNRTDTIGLRALARYFLFHRTFSREAMDDEDFAKDNVLVYTVFPLLLVGSS